MALPWLVLAGVCTLLSAPTVSSDQSKFSTTCTKVTCTLVYICEVKTANFYTCIWAAKFEKKTEYRSFYAVKELLVQYTARISTKI